MTEFGDYGRLVVDEEVLCQRRFASPKSLLNDSKVQFTSQTNSVTYIRTKWLLVVVTEMRRC